MKKLLRALPLLLLVALLLASCGAPADDGTMASWFKTCGKPFVVVANKLDKCKKSEIEGSIARIRETFELDDSVRVIPFSAEKGSGKEELLSEIMKFC